MSVVDGLQNWVGHWLKTWSEAERLDKESMGFWRSLAGLLYRPFGGEGFAEEACRPGFVKRTPGMATFTSLEMRYLEVWRDRATRLWKLDAWRIFSTPA